MNVKADKIEQIIQVINRNLLLVSSGNLESATPLEFRNLQRIDAGVFGNDKFAFEMVHFVKNELEKSKPEGSLAHAWEKAFVQGLETLLVECAVVKDDIERDCFVSRVYCWFTEKLSERRALPRPVLSKSDLENLRESVKGLQSDSSNTVRALDAYARKLAASTSTANASAAATGRWAVLILNSFSFLLLSLYCTVGRYN